MESDKKNKEYIIFHRERCDTTLEIEQTVVEAKNKTEARRNFSVINHVIVEIKQKVNSDTLWTDTDNIDREYNPLGAENWDKGRVRLKNGVSITKERYKVYCEVRKTIEDSFKEARRLYLVIGCALYKADYCKLYELERYENIYDFANAHFGISRGTTNEYLNVVKNFCKYEVGGWESKGHPVPELKEKYEDYSVSQLKILMRVKDETLKSELKPEISTRKMKDMVKEHKENKPVQMHINDMAAEKTETEMNTDSDDKAENESQKKQAIPHVSSPPPTKGMYIVLVFRQGYDGNDNQLHKYINGNCYEIARAVWDGESWDLLRPADYTKEVVISWKPMPTFEDFEVSYD